MLSAGTYIASKIASFTVRKPKPIAVFSPAQWDYYRQNWPASHQTSKRTP